MSEPKRPLKVFLCHAHADRDPVRGLYTRLTKDGVDVWLDKEKLLGGEDWEYEIRNAVRESDIVVVCHSKQFNQKGFRQKEVKIALEEADLLPKGEIFIIPVRLEECDVLDDLKRWHWVDLFESDGYERLLRALHVRADKIGVTFQAKRGWLPRITIPPTVYKRPVVIKDSEEPKVNPIYTMGEIPDDEPPDKFPAGWDTEWMPSAGPEKAKNEGGENAEHEATAKQFKIQPSSKRTYNTTSFISVVALVFCVASITLIPVLGSLSKTSEPTPTAQVEFANTVEVTSSPSSTLVVNEILPLTSTPTISATPTLLPAEITDAKGVSMMFVPAGNFIAGKKGSERNISLSAFYIDKYEVTNFNYSLCVPRRACAPPADTVLASYEYYGNPQYDNFPVVWVNSQMAQAYCKWRGARLPTVLEWEKAARGTDGRLYPWGNDLDDVKRSNSYDSDGYQITSPVGAFPEGVSPYGVYDMAGNVAEWTSDQISIGSTWRYGDEFMFDSQDYLVSDGSGPDKGFRCARDANP